MDNISGQPFKSSSRYLRKISTLSDILVSPLKKNPDNEHYLSEQMSESSFWMIGSAVERTASWGSWGGDIEHLCSNSQSLEMTPAEESQSADYTLPFPLTLRTAYEHSK